MFITRHTLKGVKGSPRNKVEGSPITQMKQNIFLYVSQDNCEKPTNDYTALFKMAGDSPVSQLLISWRSAEREEEGEVR